MAWVYLDDQFPDHPKVAAAGGDAAWLFVCGLAYVKRYSTEGVIPKGQVVKLSDRRQPNKLARRLVEVGLWVDDGNVYRIHDYHQWNRSGEARSAAARKAAQARWRNGNKPSPEDEPPPPEHPPSDAEAMHDACETHSGRTAKPDAQTYASTCPLPLPPEELTSSDGLTTRPDPPDDDDDHPPPDPPTVVRQAVAILAARDLTQRQNAPNLPPIGDPTAWENTAYDRRIAVAWPLIRLHQDHPDWTAEQLANFAEPPPATTHTNGQTDQHTPPPLPDITDLINVPWDPPPMHRKDQIIGSAWNALRQPHNPEKTA